MALDWNKVIEQALATATVVLPVVVPAVIGGLIKLRRLEHNQQTALKNQDRIEQKADGNHARALEAVKETSRYSSDQIVKAVEKVLAAQAPRRAEKRSTDVEPDPTPKRGRRSTDKKEPGQ